MKKIFFTVFAIILSTLTSVTLAGDLRYKSFPISVYIDQSPHKATVKQAFMTWTNLTRIAKFTYTNSPNEANIIVTFEEQPAVEKNQAYVAGTNINYPTKDNYISKSLITIKSNVPGKNIKMYDRQIYLVSLHEIGHALGLEHSNNPTDVMYYMTQHQMMLSTNDLNAFKTLYSSK